MEQKKNRALLITIACVLAFCIAASAMTVDKFTDYNPPSTLSITWGDYRVGSMSGNISSNNSVTAYPEQTAAYPYRAFFFGGKPVSATIRDKYYGYVFVVYSKKPTDSVLTFQYLDGTKPVANTGYIKATYDRELIQNGDIIIKTANWSDYISGGLLDCQALAIWSNYYNSSKSSTYTGWFEFDFYYTCTDKHQQNSQLLTIPGLRSIANVPYAYILTCDAHGTGGGAESGSSSGGSSSGGTSSEDESSGGSSSGDESSDPEIDPDYPWEKDEKTPDYGNSSQGSSHSSGSEGDTGERGGSWSLPEYSTPDNLPFGDKDLNIPSMPNTPAAPSVPTPDFNLPDSPGMPGLNFPEMPYTPGGGSWPPAFPS